MNCPGAERSLTFRELIDRVDELAPNQYSDAQKVRWLRDLDGRVLNELYWSYIRRREPFPDDEDAALDAELVIREPYASDIYENYLLSRIAERNAEIQKYNLYAALFNEAYQSYCRCYGRKHRAKWCGGWRV